jgi:hypothetical protein
MSTPKDESLKLVYEALPFALKMLRENGGFHPYGWVMTAEQKFEIVGAYSGSDSPDPGELIAMLKGTFVDGARAGRFRATALVISSMFTPTGGVKTDAIALEICHAQEGYAVTYVFPYTTKPPGTVNLGTGVPMRSSNYVFSE